MNRREFNRFALLGSLAGAASMHGAETFSYPWKLGIITDACRTCVRVCKISFAPA